PPPWEPEPPPESKQPHLGPGLWVESPALPQALPVSTERPPFPFDPAGEPNPGAQRAAEQVQPAFALVEPAPSEPVALLESPGALSAPSYDLPAGEPRAELSSPWEHGSLAPLSTD